MGFGDWLMASAQVKEANERTGKKVFLGDGTRTFFEPEVFLHNPRMAHDGDTDVTWVANYGGARPYILGDKDKHFIFNDHWRPTPGELFFSDAELAWAKERSPSRPYIVIEPTVKNRFAHGVNKAWPYWGELVGAPFPFVRLGMEEGGFPLIKTKSFREGMLILKDASLFVGTDGGLHHAAAAMGVPAVVIWTGFSSPVHLGYDTHANIHDGSYPCGTYSGRCEHCIEKAKAIKPETVLKAINEEYPRSVAARSRKASG